MFFGKNETHIASCIVKTERVAPLSDFVFFFNHLYMVPTKSHVPLFSITCIGFMCIQPVSILNLETTSPFKIEA